MILYLMRHGQSRSNLDLDEYSRIPNPLIEITEEGQKQAREAGNRIVGHMGSLAAMRHPIFVWSSPYARAAQSAIYVRDRFAHCNYREDVLLIEQNYGLAIGEPSTEAFCQKCPQQTQLLFRAGKMYTTLPQGESKTDVAVRAELFLHKIMPYDFRHVVVSHQGFCHMLHSQITGEYPDVWDWANGEVRVYRTSLGGSFMEYEGKL